MQTRPSICMPSCTDQLESSHGHLNGFADDFIYKTRNISIDIFSKYNMNIVFKSTDGDHNFDKDHEAAFEAYKECLWTGGTIEEIIEIVKEFMIKTPWPISDFLHTHKNIRANVLFTKIGPYILSKFDSKEFLKFVKSKN